VKHEAAPPAEPAKDPAHVTVIAKNPQEMEAAQVQLVSWASKRLDKAIAEHAELEENYHIAVKRKWRSDLLKRHTAKAAKGVEFWDKVCEALKAGYCLVPNLPVDVWAIRTTKKRPKKMESGSQWNNRDQSSDKPMIGEGRYVDAVPTEDMRLIDRYDKDGAYKPIEKWFADEFTEVEFPFAMIKPQIMEATATAMQRMIFDDFGVTPSRRRRAKGDPIIVGRLHSPKGSTLSFLVAWWVNTEDL
jgi:hypothetical protein